MYFFLNTGHRFYWNPVEVWFPVSHGTLGDFWTEPAYLLTFVFFVTLNIILSLPSWIAHGCLWLLALLSFNPKSIPFISRSIPPYEQINGFKKPWMIQSYPSLWSLHLVYLFSDFLCYTKYSFYFCLFSVLVYILSNPYKSTRFYCIL